MEDTDLRDYSKTSQYYKLSKQDKFYQKYSIYAYMCWNLVETIYDRQKDSKGKFKLSETWLPVMFDENRLHYAWYKHNLNLFKSEFQDFITGTLNDIEIIEGDSSNLEEIYEKMQSDFPLNENKSYSHLKMLMDNNKYKLLLARHKVFGLIIGYAFIYNIPELNLIWLDYMAIEKKFQNSGYGTLLFNKLSEMYYSNEAGIFLEVEIPAADEQKNSDKVSRIRFYERLGAKRININYIFPNNEGGLPLYLYFRPSASMKILPKETLENTIYSVFEYIHSDIKDWKKIYDKFKDDIKDVYFD